MNYFIDHMHTKQGRGEAQKLGKKICLLNTEVNTQFRFNAEKKQQISNASLPWEILEAAYFFFQKKGFEKTTIPDICNRINIKRDQFYKHFKSLDEVLEILWAR